MPSMKVQVRIYTAADTNCIASQRSVSVRRRHRFGLQLISFGFSMKDEFFSFVLSPTPPGQNSPLSFRGTVLLKLCMYVITRTGRWELTGGVELDEKGDVVPLPCSKRGLPRVVDPTVLMGGQVHVAHEVPVPATQNVAL